MARRGRSHGRPLRSDHSFQQAGVPRPLGQFLHRAAEAGEVGGLIRVPCRGEWTAPGILEALILQRSRYNHPRGQSVYRCLREHGVNVQEVHVSRVAARGRL